MTPVLPPEFWQGVEEFNQGEFYACHDTLEALWMEAADPPKSLYQAFSRLRWPATTWATRTGGEPSCCWGEGLHRLQRYPCVYAGMELERFREQTHQLLQALQQAGPADFSQWLGDRPEVSEQSATQPQRVAGLSLPQLRRQQP